MSTRKIRTKIATIAQAQQFVKQFTKNNKWDDIPTVDKFDHLHEELIEMSKFLRYKTPQQRKQIIKTKKDIFQDGIGDLFFGLCRLANQLNVDVEEAFNQVKNQIVDRFEGKQEGEKHL